MIEVNLEIGNKRTFAGAVEWPGWCRSGRDEAAALQAFVASGERYRKVATAAGLELDLPDGVGDLVVTERLAGDGTTDFGAPGRAPAVDARSVDEAELCRLVALINACWNAYDRAVAAATDKELRRGPRGGGRSLEEIVRHVAEAEAAYLRQVGWKAGGPPGAGSDGEMQRRQAVVEALGAGSRGELPVRGPRGGRYWTTRYLARRAAWHLLDHAWEIEDRAEATLPAPGEGTALVNHVRTDRVAPEGAESEGR